MTIETEQHTGDVQPSAPVNQLQFIHKLFSFVPTDSRIQQQLLKRTPSFVKNVVASTATAVTPVLTTVEQRLSSNALVHKVDVFAANQLERLQKVDANLVKTSTVDFVSESVRITDTFVSNSMVAAPVRLALDFVEHRLPSEPAVAQPQAVDNIQASSSQQQQQQQVVVVDEQQRVILRAGRLTRRLQRAAFSQFREKLNTTSNQVSAVSGRLHEMVQHRQQLAGDLIGVAAANLQSLGKIASTSLQQAQAFGSSSLHAVRSVPEVWRELPTVRELAIEAIDALKTAYMVLERNPPEIVVRTQLAIKYFVQQLEAAKQQAAGLPHFDTLSNVIAPKMLDISASIRRATHEETNVAMQHLRQLMISLYAVFAGGGVAPPLIASDSANNSNSNNDHHEQQQKQHQSMSSSKEEQVADEDQ